MKREENISFIKKMRNLNKREKQLHEEMIKKASKDTGINVYDLLNEEKN